MEKLQELLPKFKYALSPEEKSVFEGDKKKHQELLRKHNIRAGQNCESVPLELIEATQDAPHGPGEMPAYKVGDRIWVVCVPAFLESLSHPIKIRTLPVIDKYFPDLIKKAEDWGIRNNKTTLGQLEQWWNEFISAKEREEEANQFFK